MARRRSIDLSDPGSVLRTTGELRVGAAEGRRRRDALLATAGGLALIGGAVGLALLLWPPGTVPANTAPRVYVKCVAESCGYAGVVNVPLGAGKYPRECPRCHKRSCQRVWECRSCGHQFLPKGAPGPELRCELCSSAQVGSAEGPPPETPAPPAPPAPAATE